MRLGLCMLALAAARGADSPPSLERIRTRMQANLANIPKYTCTETIDRTSFTAVSPDIETSERIRVEVLMVGNREFVSWPGESRFEDKTIDQLISYGTSVMGHFAGFAAGVFLQDPGAYVPRGEVNILGRRVLRYDYEVESDVSRLTLRMLGLSSIVGYGGSFFVDPQTLDVVRLEVQVMRIPGWLGVEAARTAIDYGRVPIGEASFLLPHATDTLVRYTSGEVGHNRTRYDSCRQYTAESSVRFSDETPALKPSRTGAAGQRAAALPAGVWLDSRLESNLVLARCAIGDPIQVVLERPVRERGVALPKGTPIQGRITRLETLKRNRPRLRRGGSEPREVTTLGIRFARIGAATPFHARLLRCSAPPDSFLACAVLDDELLIRLEGPNAWLTRNLHLRWETEESFR